ncbi:MAG: hypothetical protein IPK21_21705 [Haliscomenobacter sp.]|nr:hypothetical protein [Haliscomenobacter sp.]
MLRNGKPVKVQGVNCRQDHAGVGSALPDELQYYRIRLLKELGVNAYRASHNPPTPELLDACDSLGMLVMDETRLLNSSPEYMSQFERLVRRDRNHPSIFMWSIGNEEGWAQTNNTGPGGPARRKHGGRFAPRTPGLWADSSGRAWITGANLRLTNGPTSIPTLGSWTCAASPKTFIITTSPGGKRRMYSTFPRIGTGRGKKGSPSTFG